MKGLLLKEWYQNVWALALLFLLILPRDGNLFAPACMIALIIGIYPLWSIAADQRSRFDRYQLTLPIAKEKRWDVYYVLLAVMTAVLLLLFYLLHGRDLPNYDMLKHMTSYAEFEIYSKFHSLMTVRQYLCAQIVCTLLPAACYIPAAAKGGRSMGLCIALLPYIVIVLVCSNLSRAYVQESLFGMKIYESELLFEIAAGAALVLFLLSRMLTVRTLREAEY